MSLEAFPNLSRFVTDFEGAFHANSIISHLLGLA
jgi:hypothetical protein